MTIRPSIVIGVPVRNQLSGLSLLGPMKSTPSIGMSFSLMAFCTQCWYFRKLSVHGSPLRSPFRNFSANQRLKHWSYSRFSSVHASPTLFISGDTRRNLDQEAKCGRVPLLFKSAGPRTLCVTLRAGIIYTIRGITLEEISDLSLTSFQIN